MIIFSDSRRLNTKLFPQIIMATVFLSLAFAASNSFAAADVNLAAYGGIPGAAPAQITSAFSQAFQALKNAGGGTLTVNPGVYNIGNRQDSDGVLAFAQDMDNVTISGYGAKFFMTTTSGSPVFFQFHNCSNITVKGMSFYDYGCDLKINWKGAICLAVSSNTPHSGFITRDCTAEKVVTFLQSTGQWASTAYSFTGFDIQAKVLNSYYGVNSNHIGSFSKCNLTVENVRRAFISYGCKNWDVVVNAASDGVSPGSNGLIEVVPIGQFGSYPSSQSVENISIDLTVTGNISNYSGMVHFYNQGPLEAPVYTKNVKANVKYNNVITGNCNMFIFDHEYPSPTIPAVSPRTYRQIKLTGSVTGGKFTGKIIHHPTLSSGSENDIDIESNLAVMQNNLSGLPDYFHIIPAP
jgi:hypothetical protein